MDSSYEKMSNRRLFRTQTPHTAYSELLQIHRKIRNNGLVAIFWNPMSILLIAFPLGIISGVQGWGPNATFWLNFCALLPFAKILGDATEELDASLDNQVLSGLINATFGNAVEMIVTVNALKANLVNVVKMSLLGSVISNMLLVLGMSLFAGGIFDKSTKSLVTEKEERFKAHGAMENVTMLLLSSISFTLPTIFKLSGQPESAVLTVSRVGSCILLASYCCYLVFQLYTHRQAMADIEDDGGREEAEEDAPSISIGTSLMLLFAAAVCTGISSEYLVDSIEGCVKGSGISEAFIGVILLPFVGNACEHMAAVRFAMHDKPNLSIGISVGSSTQIALFVVPCSVVIGWAMDVKMTLDFGGFDTAVLVLSVLVLMSVVLDGRSNWLEGWLLMSAYAFIAVMYWNLKDLA